MYTLLTFLRNFDNWGIRGEGSNEEIVQTGGKYDFNRRFPLTIKLTLPRRSILTLSLRAACARERSSTAAIRVALTIFIAKKKKKN